MSVAGKTSLKKSRPNYIYSIVGVSLVLLMMGIMGWLFLNARGIEKAFKEDVRISCYLRSLNKDTVEQIRKFVESQPFAKNVSYVNKDAAKAIWNNDNNEDWAKILEANPLPESIDFYAIADYVNKDSLKKITTTITTAFGNQVTEVNYPPVLVSNMDKVARKWGIVFLVVAIILSLIVIFIIDNTIRLAMFSNRFLIKTMQMVGATRGFIAKPMSITAVINGFISSVIAIVLLFTLVTWIESLVPELKQIHNMQLNIMIISGMLVVGIGISLFSTYRSVIKYLKMKLDDLY
jgi:cell division transport system permease protein